MDTSESKWNNTLYTCLDIRGINMYYYKKIEAPAMLYNRCNNVNIGNPIVGSKMVSLSEEQVSIVDGVITTRPIRTLQVEFKPETVETEIQLRNPETGELLGSSVNYGELYGILFSLYIQLAEESNGS